MGAERVRPDPELVQTFGLLRTMLVGGQLNRAKLRRLAAAAADVAALGLEQGFPGVRWWAPHKPFQFVAGYLNERPPLKPGPFGWKHPGTHLMLPELLEAFPRARYIHVLRDPLDMAWSSNVQGVRLWAAVAGIDPSELDARPQNAQLAWWLHSTRLALAAGRELGNRFMLVRLEHLVDRPRAVAGRLAAFAGLEPDREALGGAIESVHQAESIGRSADKPLDVFDPALLAEAQAYVSRWNAQSSSSAGEAKPHGGEDGPAEGEDRTEPDGAAEASSPEPVSDRAS